MHLVPELHVSIVVGGRWHGSADVPMTRTERSHRSTEREQPMAAEIGA